MNDTIKRLIAYGTICALGLTAFVIARQPIVHYATDVVTFVKEYSDAQDGMLQALRKEVFGKPLKINVAGDRADLSAEEIITLTNAERKGYGSQPLARNVLLDQAATLKLQDMFERQYFDHISPDGHGPSYVAEKAGYSYVIIGENLAMGTFDSDRALVDAWMASEGHRENILNPKYSEIGVAVGHGTFNGERIWLAVQEFGKPTSECPVIDASLRATIEKDKEVVSGLSTQITHMKTELETMNHTTAEESAAYNAKVAEYNNTVSIYNNKVASLKSEIDTYNQQVRGFNTCAEQ